MFRERTHQEAPGGVTDSDIEIAPQAVNYRVIVYGKRYAPEPTDWGYGATDYIIINSSRGLGLSETTPLSYELRQVLELSQENDYDKQKIPDLFKNTRSVVPAIVCKFRKQQGYFFELFGSEEGRYAASVGGAKARNRPFFQARMTFFPLEDIISKYRHFAAFYPGLYTGKIHPEWVPSQQRIGQTPERLHMYGSRPIDPTLETTLPRIGKLFNERRTGLYNKKPLLIAKIYNALQTKDSVFVECLCPKGTYDRVLIASTIAYLEASAKQPKPPFEWSTDPVVNGLGPRGLLFRQPHEGLPIQIEDKISRLPKHFIIDVDNLSTVTPADVPILQKLNLFQQNPPAIAHKKLMLGGQ